MNPVDWEGFAIFAMTSVTVVLVDHLRKRLDKSLEDKDRDSEDKDD